MGDKEYRKYFVSIPLDQIEEAGLSVGDEVDVIAKRHELILKLNKKK